MSDSDTRPFEVLRTRPGRRYRRGVVRREPMAPMGVACPGRGSVDVQARPSRQPRPSRRRDRPWDVSVRTDPLTHASPRGLRVRANGIYLMTTCPKGVSSRTPSRVLGITLKTAWFLDHRIRDKGESFDFDDFLEFGEDEPQPPVSERRNGLGLIREVESEVADDGTLINARALGAWMDKAALAARTSDVTGGPFDGSGFPMSAMVGDSPRTDPTALGGRTWNAPWSGPTRVRTRVSRGTSPSESKTLPCRPSTSPLRRSGALPGCGPPSDGTIPRSPTRGSLRPRFRASTLASATGKSPDWSTGTTASVPSGHVGNRSRFSEWAGPHRWSDMEPTGTVVPAGRPARQSCAGRRTSRLRWSSSRHRSFGSPATWHGPGAFFFERGGAVMARVSRRRKQRCRVGISTDPYERVRKWDGRRGLRPRGGSCNGSHLREGTGAGERRGGGPWLQGRTWRPPGGRRRLVRLRRPRLRNPDASRSSARGSIMSRTRR